MPMKWVEPEVAMTIRGVEIYHTYKNECLDGVRHYWFSTDSSESPDCEFDVRDLPVPAGVADHQFKLIIAHALDNDLIPSDYEIELDPMRVEARIEGMANPASGVAVDLAPWLDTASAADICIQVRGGWGQDSRTDDIARVLQSQDYVAAGFLSEFEYGADAVRVVADGDKALAYLKEHREDIYWAAMCELGRAVKVTGTVTEEVTISKEVETVVLLSEEQLQEYVSVADDGKAEIDYLALNMDGQFAESMDQAVRDKAYLRTITDEGHDWEPIETTDVSVNAEFA